MGFICSRRTLYLVSLSLLFVGLAGCGAGIYGGASSPSASGNTYVTVLLSSSSNAQYVSLPISIQALTLTSQNGNTVTVYQNLANETNTDAAFDFMALNGAPIPAFTASIPEGVYTKATIVTPKAGITFVAPDSDSIPTPIHFYTYSMGAPTEPAVIQMPAPITVSGTSQTLQLDLITNLSAYISSYSPSQLGPYSLTPTFRLVAQHTAADPTNCNNGKLSNLMGQITSITPSVMTVRLLGNGLAHASNPGPPEVNLSFSLDESTLVQGVSSSVAALAAGEFISLDATQLSDGSYLATRIASNDPWAKDMLVGQILYATPSTTQYVQIAPLFQDGDVLTNAPLTPSYDTATTSATTYQVAGGYTLTSLPFTAHFDANSTAIGQNVALGAAAISSTQRYTPPYTATSLTLMPQTVSGAVASINQSGDYTVYILQLDPSDLIYSVGKASYICIYTNSATAQLNHNPLQVGSLARFRGLLFNDNGVLRLVSEQSQNGVPNATPPAASYVRSLSAGHVQELVTKPMTGQR